MMISLLQTFHSGGISQCPPDHWQPKWYRTVCAVPTRAPTLCVSVAQQDHLSLTQLTSPHIHSQVVSTMLGVTGVEDWHTGELAYVLMFKRHDAGGARTAPLEALAGQVHCCCAHIPATNQ